MEKDLEKIYKKQYGQYHKDFKKIFGVELNIYHNNWIGFDQSMFAEEFLEVEINQLKEKVLAKYGNKALSLVEKLMQMPS